MARAISTINIYFHVIFNLSGVFLIYAVAFGATQVRSDKKLNPNDSQETGQLLSICQDLFSHQFKNDQNKYLLELNAKLASKPSLVNQIIEKNSEISGELPYTYTKRQGINGGKKLNMDNIRIMQLFGYYPSRGTNRRKVLTNPDNSPFHKPQTRSPLLVHFRPWVDNYSFKSQLKNSNGIVSKNKADDSKTNNISNKTWKQPASKESYEAFTQQDLPQKPLKGFAFTSNHWGPMG